MLIATLPPYVRHREVIARHPLVDGLRFNTIMPIGEPKPEVLADLVRLAGEKPLWIDLKARQLRITRFAYLPYAFVEISRRIRVELPARVLFRDCEAEIVRVVDGDKLILAGRPPRVVGAGEPITILARSLEIEGYLTDDDREWIAAARAEGVHDYLLSFVEGPDDVQALVALDPDARPVAKIESARGVATVGALGTRLMAARDDLYLQLGAQAILPALEAIVAADATAICASRVLTSLEHGETVSLADLADVELMRRMGYRAFMLSDGLCFAERCFARAMDAWAELAAR